jgi:hypothetical protein
MCHVVKGTNNWPHKERTQDHKSKAVNSELQNLSRNTTEGSKEWKRSTHAGKQMEQNCVVHISYSTHCDLNIYI